MRKGKVVLLPIFIVALLMVAGLVVGLIYKHSAHPKEKSIFVEMNTERLEQMGIKASLDGAYRIPEAKEFGYTGSGTVYAEKKNIQSIGFQTDLKNKETDQTTAEAVRAFLTAYSDELGFTIPDHPAVVPFTDDASYQQRPADDYDALQAGYVMFEYSYRDAEGSLWISQVYSPRDHVLCGMITKQIDETGYEDFEPQIDMTKEVVEK